MQEVEEYKKVGEKSSGPSFQQQDENSEQKEEFCQNVDHNLHLYSVDI